jgi:diacylglycerol kinase
MNGILSFIEGRIKSFSFALQGLNLLIKKEHNFQFHILATVITLTLSFVFEIDRNQWMLVAIAIISVLSTEAVNTSIEKICDHVEPNKHPQIKAIKDIAAGAVFLSALLALIIGSFVFIPYFL